MGCDTGPTIDEGLFDYIEDSDLVNMVRTKDKIVTRETPSLVPDLADFDYLDTTIRVSRKKKTQAKNQSILGKLTEIKRSYGGANRSVDLVKTKNDLRNINNRIRTELSKQKTDFLP